MKFEEVLPKMRDEGRVGIWNGHRHKFVDGMLQWEEDCPWPFIHYSGRAFTSDSWTLEPLKVNKWSWVFGHGDKCQMVPHNKMTEIEAECYKITHDHEWMERIEHAMVEEEE